MENLLEKVVSAIQQIKENSFSKDYVIPLLESMGYHNVEFYGGTDELGKDIIAWEKDKIEELKLVVIQVKHFKVSNNFSGKKSLANVVNQLITCLKKSLLYSDKRSYLPNEVFLISTHQIDSKTLQTRFSDYPDLIDGRIKIIDGVKISTLLIKYKPDLIYKLLGQDMEIASKLNSDLNNEILLRALGYQHKKSIKLIYTDIDFSLGKRSTELLFNCTFNPRISKLSFIAENDWEDFKYDCLRTNRVYPLNFLNMSFEQAEAQFRAAKEIYERKTRGELLKEQNIIDEKKETDETEKAEENKGNSKPMFQVEIDGSKISKMLVESRAWVEKGVKGINSQKQSKSELKSFIIQCREIFNASSIFFNDTFCNSIGVNVESVIRSNLDNTRLKMSIQNIFDTGINLIVLGEAGAGKTTSLQMYALDHEQEAGKIYIPISLSNLCQYKYINSPEDKLEVILGQYLTSKGVNITIEQFIGDLKSKQIVLLLDGLDEAIKENPFLPTAIRRLGENYSENLQIVVTSRASGSYIREIPFFAVTILPFTDEQRSDFISKWFSSKGDERVKRINRHLSRNPGLADIVNTPLLTTILCVLANNEVELPNTEIKLYNERLKLLTGYYDRVKNINNRIISTPQTLEFIAQKVAYSLHCAGKRDADKSELLEFAKFSSLYVLSIKEAETALNELIDPCNLLVPMSDDGSFGFGHLRYQEHLSAKEILSDRGIDIIPLVKNPWWQGCLSLFTLMNSDFKWFVRQLGDRSLIIPLKEQLKTLLKYRPVPERKQLIGLIENYLRTEAEDLKSINNFLSEIE